MMVVINYAEIGSKTLNTEIDQALTLKALPSVNLHFPPDGLAKMFLQLLHAITH